MSIQMPYKIVVENQEEPIFAHNPKSVVARARPYRRKGYAVDVQKWDEQFEEYLDDPELTQKVLELNSMPPKEKAGEGSLKLYNSLNQLSYVAAYLAPIARARSLDSQMLVDLQAAIQSVASLVEFPSEESIEA